MINNEIVQLVNHISSKRKWIQIYKKNIFALFNCIINKIPIFIYSKTLNYELLKDN